MTIWSKAEAVPAAAGLNRRDGHLQINTGKGGCTCGPLF
jgi:hypothetical protein